jgi:phosphoglycerate dehydrogenase-like enzyme
MEVSYWSENSRDKRFTYKELENLLEDSDVIFHSLARNEATEKLITEELFSHLKPSVLFVTIAHTNHKMMIQLSETGKIA